MTPYFFRLEIFGISEMWTTARPRVTDWWDGIQARPNLRGVISPDTPAAGLEHLRTKGAEAWPKVREVLAAG